MPKIHMASKFGDKTYESLAEYTKENPGWEPVEEAPGTKLTMELLEKAGKEGVKMGKSDVDEGHTLHFVKDGGRRKKTRRGRKVRRTRKSRR